MPSTIVIRKCGRQPSNLNCRSTRVRGLPMALTLRIETDQPVEFEECLELLDRQLDPDDYDSLAEAAVLLKKLANNRRFLVNHVNDSLLNWRSEHSNAVGDTAFCLARKGPICIR